MRKILIVLIICFSLTANAQEGKEDLQKIKDALVTSVIKSQELEKQVANLNATIKTVADDLKKIKTVEQLDSLKVVYGILPKKQSDESKIKKIR